MQSFKCLCAVDRPYFDARYRRSPRHFCSNGCDFAYANKFRLLLLPVFAISFPGDPSALHRFLFSETISFTFPCLISNSFMFVCARFKVSPLSPKTCGYGARRHFSEAEASRVWNIISSLSLILVVVLLSASYSLLLSLAFVSMASSSSSSFLRLLLSNPYFSHHSFCTPVVVRSIHPNSQKKTSSSSREQSRTRQTKRKFHRIGYKRRPTGQLSSSLNTTTASKVMKTMMMMMEKKKTFHPNNTFGKSRRRIPRGVDATTTTTTTVFSASPTITTEERVEEETT